MEPYKWCDFFSDAAAALTEELKILTATVYIVNVNHFELNEG